ncbi:hypothetical protein M408DRAFT_166380 [Serendipita vermifera MAFF 305830]|uniref:MARVEL domain-containing protein n=1 Tax=Serendipita vermifera MAFF 305830 TaxID=933852 RepID=A0A0C3B7W3_SERVB|nr:hypothetical protein M408DRAFT_166380 [Serendipita vermifera MAFF 305830]
MPAHPVMYILLGLVAAAETGLLAYLVNTFEASGYPSGQGTNGSPNQMRMLIILLLFTASWTTLFALCFLCFVGGTLGLLASIGFSLLWLVITITLWAVSTTLFHLARVGGECIGSPTVSVCRQLEAVEALGWTALGLCVLTVFAALFGWHNRRYYRTGSYRY